MCFPAVLTLTLCVQPCSHNRDLPFYNSPAQSRKLVASILTLMQLRAISPASTSSSAARLLFLFRSDEEEENNLIKFLDDTNFDEVYCHPLDPFEVRNGYILSRTALLLGLH